MFDIENMSKELIAYYWQRAELCAESIWNAYCTEQNVGQAKLDQKWLQLWLKEAKEAGLIYNGSLDEYVAIKI